MIANRKQLLRILAAIGKPTETLTFADGTRVLLLPSGGRVLGLFAPHDDVNFFWTHAALQSVTTARPLYVREDWPNSGGDRTWLAPEADLFIADPRRMTQSYRVPPSLDPGSYVLEKSSGPLRPVCLRNRATVELPPSRKKVEVEIVKSILPAPNPLRCVRDHSPALAYAGYTLRTSLQIISGTTDPGIELGLWNILQLPHGGDMIITTFGRVKPRMIFGKIAPADLEVNHGAARYRMRAAGNHKISFRATAITGRVGYLYKTNGRQWNLIVRNFGVNPSGEYLDTPWDDRLDRGYCFQACNVNSKLGRFSELEYHAPAISQAEHLYGQDQSQVWAFRGGAGPVRQVCRLLLGGEAHEYRNCGKSIDEMIGVESGG